MSVLSADHSVLRRTLMQRQRAAVAAAEDVAQRAEGRAMTPDEERELSAAIATIAEVDAALRALAPTKETRSTP